MATKIEFRNEQTDEIKSVKVGWSWTLFLFGGALGIPLFLRKVYQPAIAILAWNLVTILVPLSEQMDVITKGVGIGLAFYLGAQGNKITAQHYAKHGWSIVDPESDAAVEARARWSLA